LRPTCIQRGRQTKKASSANDPIFLSFFSILLKITLVATFVDPCWKRSNTQGALFAIALDVSSWLLLEIFYPNGMYPPQLFGLLMSLAGSLISSKRRV